MNHENLYSQGKVATHKLLSFGLSGGGIHLLINDRLKICNVAKKVVK